MQTLIVTLLVVGCIVYAAWALMPAALRRPLAAALLGLPLPGRLRRTVEAAARQKAGGCGCDGCDRAAKPPARPATVQPLTFHRRARR